MGAGCGGGSEWCVCLCPFFHFFVAAGGDCACEGCFDELGCESEEFLVSVFVDVRDDLSLCVCWICVSGVHERAGDSDFADCFEFVCV